MNAIPLTLLLATAPLSAQGPARPSVDHEAAVRAEANRFLASKYFALRYKDRVWARYTSATLAQHPLLRDFLPGYRMYLTEVSILLKGRPETQVLHEYYLCIVDAKTGKARLIDRGTGAEGGKPWELDALDFVVKAGVRAKDEKAALRVFDLLRCVRRLAVGTSTFAPDKPHALSQKRLERKFGIGLPKPNKPPRAWPEPRIVESPKHWRVVYWGQHSDDWRMPVSAWFRWLTVRKSDGMLVGEQGARGKIWPYKEFSEVKFKKEVERFLATLKKD